MVELWILITILCLLTVTGGTLLALRQFYRSLGNSRQEREAWQQAQEGRQRTWEVRQGKHVLDAEKKLADQLKDARREWRDWGAQTRQEHQEWRENVDLEKALARLPHIEQIELAHQAAGGRIPPEDWRPPTFYKADLRGRDLSYRYMVRADLREVQLREATLYMADLAGVSLAGADLQQANLIGINLSGADLRGANLSGANLMVADLHNAVLHGANLTGACNLTPEQLQSAIYDSTTLIDSAIDITLPRIPSVLTTAPKLLSAVSTNATRIDESTNTPSERAASISIPAFEQPTPSAAPTSTAEASTNEGADAALCTEADTNLPALATPQASEMSAPEREQSTDTPALPEENKDTLPESQAPASETSRKKNAGKKRSSKTKQNTVAPTQMFASEPEETNIEYANTSYEPATTDEEEEIEEEENLPNKIIQWPARAPKTSPLPNSSEQNDGNRPQKNRGNNLTASFNGTSDDSKNQRIQAN